MQSPTAGCGTITDEAFVDMAINFHEATLRAHHVDNFLFVGVGRRTCETLCCFYYADDPTSGKASASGRPAFIRKMNIRTDAILEAVAANFTVIHTDIDVGFLGNPVGLLRDLLYSISVIRPIHCEIADNNKHFRLIYRTFSHFVIC